MLAPRDHPPTQSVSSAPRTCRLIVPLLEDALIRMRPVGSNKYKLISFVPRTTSHHQYWCVFVYHVPCTTILRTMHQFGSLSGRS